MFTQIKMLILQTGFYNMRGRYKPKKNNVVKLKKYLKTKDKDGKRNISS